MKEKPIVGQTVYSQNTGNEARNCVIYLTACEVVKVGRKYFTCRPQGKSSWAEEQYHLSDWRQKSKYSATSVLYTNKKEWEEMREAKKICQKISEVFRYGGNLNGISIGNLRAIKVLIK